jgi:putative transposase
LNLKIMRLIDKQHTLGKVPFGQLNMVHYLSCKLKMPINRKRVQRLMRRMGLEGLYEKKKTTKFCKEHEKYPYLLRDYTIRYPNEVWSTDITYIPMRHGYMFLVAIIDWFSRYVISWEISNSLDNWFCIEALERALKKTTPKIFNTDQGSQFTAESFINILEDYHIEISMDGKGRSLDNVFIERFWRTLKYEDIYRRSYETTSELVTGLKEYIHYYNTQRPHQSLGHQTPYQVYCVKS